MIIGKWKLKIKTLNDHWKMENENNLTDVYKARKFIKFTPLNRFRFTEI